MPARDIVGATHHETFISNDKEKNFATNDTVVTVPSKDEHNINYGDKEEQKANQQHESAPSFVEKEKIKNTENARQDT